MSEHTIINADSRNLVMIPDNSVNLIVTSPPYPMIEMWDNLFCNFDLSIREDIIKAPLTAFYKMHSILNQVWAECDRVLADNGFICINIGDATRTINDIFQLYSNHTQIINYFIQKGYSVLPDITWHKQSNAPNKFMGSGMYPAGAYVTYEHEYILIFRKGGKRIFKGNDKVIRQKSAYFWEERNVWFSDLWNIQGVSQTIRTIKSRSRNASYPFEIPYRLVNMYSVENDTVLDVFGGFGTTTLACMTANRNSISVEIDRDICETAYNTLLQSKDSMNKVIDSRLRKHKEFIDTLAEDKRESCCINKYHSFSVKTKYETEIHIQKIKSVTANPEKSMTIICDML